MRIPLLAAFVCLAPVIASAQGIAADPSVPAVPDVVVPVGRVTWSEVTGQPWGLAHRDRAAAVIRRVDGKSVRDPRTKVDPGERDLVVASPPRHGLGGTERHFRLKVEPCRRYYVNVQFRAASGTDWTPVVAKSEPIFGCQLPASRG